MMTLKQLQRQLFPPLQRRVHQQQNIQQKTEVTDLGNDTYSVPNDTAYQLLNLISSNDLVIRARNKNRKVACRNKDKSKCNYITFTLYKKESLDIKLNNIVISQTKQIKYLGLHLDSRLTCKYHIKTIIENILIKRRQMYWLTS